jgi:hypothetical protein
VRNNTLYDGGVLVCVCQRTCLPVHPAALVYADSDLVLVSVSGFASQIALAARTSGSRRWTSDSWASPALPFAPLLFAKGALLAGQIASRIFYNGQSLLAFKMIIAGFVAFFVVVVLAPLLLFTPQLACAKREGLAEYGAFASLYVMDFDQKWLHNKDNNEALRGTGDIQSLADLSNSFAVVREMRAIPFATDDVVRLLVATVAPVVPLLLTIMPFEQLLSQAIKIIF